VSLRDIALEMDLHHKTVPRLLKLSTKQCALSLMNISAHPSEVINAALGKGGSELDDLCLFDEDDFEEVVAINPAEAKSKTLRTLEEGLTKGTKEQTKQIIPHHHLSSTQNQNTTF